eukprot:scaffold102920_cov13-Tisochrysis_lutea.AAC.1
MHIHLAEVKRCEDTWPKNQLNASKHQLRDLRRHLSRASASVTLRTILLGMDGVICIHHTLESLKELGLQTQKAIVLALKLHPHSVQIAHKLACTRCALEKTSSNATQQDQAQGTAYKPPAPRQLLSSLSLDGDAQILSLEYPPLEYHTVTRLAVRSIHWQRVEHALKAACLQVNGCQ